MHSSRFIASIALAAAVALSASAQQRGAFGGAMPQRRVMTPEASAAQFAAPAGKRAMTAHRVLPRGAASSRGRLHNASVTTAAGATSPVLHAMGDGTTIYGSMIYSSDWNGTSGDYGIYSFTAGAYNKPQKVASTSSYHANGGGTYGNGKYYFNSYVYTDEMGYTFSTFCTYDFATGTMTKSTQGMLDEGFDQSQITIDMAFDPTSSTIYALGYIAVDMAEGMLYKYYPALSTVDDMTGFVTPIAKVPDLIALACSQSGELYGVSSGAGSTLYRINKETADVTAIGPTGLNPEYVQSMCFDPVTDRLYWAEVEYNGTTGLYEVDVNTGKASLITAFAAHEEFGGIYIPAPQVENGAPGRIDDLKAEFTADSHSGNVTFTAPSRTFAGATLTGEIDFEISCDGNYSELKAAAGSRVSIPLTLDEGLHSFTVTASNASGPGPRNGLSFYVGLDAPEAVHNLKLTANPGGSATISWDAPQTGRNQGFIDPALLTYTVTRSDGTIVADNIDETTVTDPVNASADKYSYTVVPFCDGREGIAASTDAAVLGSGTSLPATFGFDSADEFALFTVIDANNDYDAQYHWGGWLFSSDFPAVANAEDVGYGDNPAAVYGYSPDNAADDWLITPPFTVQEGKKYKLTYSMWTRGDKEILEVTAGPHNTVGAQSVITPATTYSHKDRRKFEQVFTASASGNYYAGFHITSGKKKYYLFIDDINIDEVPDENAPAAVTGLTVTPAPEGALSATVTFSAPALTASGAPLASITSIEIYRGNDNTSIHTFTNPEPEAELYWTDNTPLHGWNTYRVVAYIGSSAGEKAQESAFVGTDVPLAVTALTAEETDGAVKLTWTAPAGGQNGGYINTDELTYIIYRLGDDEALLTRSAQGTSYTDDALDGSAMQRFLYYEVVPVSSAGIGDWALSEHVIFGDPYKGAFRESFADAATQNNPWLTYTVKGKESGWNLRSQGYDPLCGPIDEDGGLATFESTAVQSNTEGRLVSPKLDLSSLQTPYFSFWMYHNDTSGSGSWLGEDADPYLDALIPEIQLPDGTYVALSEPILADDANVGTSWMNYVYDLSAYKNQPYVRLSLHGVAKGGQDINVDMVELYNQLQYDLGIQTFTGPSQLRAGSPAKYSVTIYNDGARQAENFTVSLKINGEVYTSVTGTVIKPNTYATVDFPIDFSDYEEGTTLSIQAVIDWALDEYAANNSSNVITTTIKGALLPEVLDINATLAGDKVTLSWNAPDAVRMNDSFEDYSSYDIENIGDYTLLDLDGAYTYGFSDIYFPNTGVPQSFMVFNPVELGIVTHESSIFGAAFDPRTGDRVLAAFGAYGTANNDWFISPAVHGGRTVRFYAKSGDFAQGVDKYEVLYSATTISPSAFTALSEVVTTGNTWELHEVSLPANAKYFAIHCVSDDGFVLMVDDLEFIEKRTECIHAHTGYNLYCDGTLIATLPASATSYTTDAPASGEGHTYTLTATYEGNRESGAASVRVGAASGIDDVSAASLRITVEESDIVVSSTEAIDVTVTNAAGINIFSGNGTDIRCTVATGAYMVSAGNTVRKVIVR